MSEGLADVGGGMPVGVVCIAVCTKGSSSTDEGLLWLGPAAS